MRQSKLIFCQIVFIIANAIWVLPFLTPTQKWIYPALERKLCDLKFKLRGAEKPSGQVAVVTFDDRAIEAFGRWKGNRQAVALVIDSIFKLGAKNVALDILFSEPVPQDNFRADQILNKTLKKYQKQLTLAWAESTDGEPILNLPQFSQTVTSQGFVNAKKDPDGVIRRLSLVIPSENTLKPSLALAAISQRLETSFQSLIKKTSALINFFGPANTLPTYSALNVVLPNQSETHSPIDLQGKTVFLGVSALGEVDHVATPFDANLAGVEVQATMADRLLTGQIPKEPFWAVWFATLSLSLLLVFLLAQVTHSQLVGMTLVGFVTVGLLDLLGFKLGIFAQTAPFYFNLVFLFFSSMGVRYLQEYRQRKFLRAAFSKYIAPEVVEVLIANPNALKLGGEKKEISILFCDIRNFTSISEKEEPAQINQLLNEIFSDLTAVIFKHQGTLDKYIGDALMAFFGAPLEQPDHAFRAIQAALDIRQTIEQKRARYFADYGIEIRVGIGVHTGTALVGNLGSKERFSYTAIGDSVNIASRLESQTKEFDVEIITSEATLNSIQGSVNPMPQTRELGQVLLKGKHHPLRLFGVSVSHQA